MLIEWTLSVDGVVLRFGKGLHLQLMPQACILLSSRLSMHLGVKILTYFLTKECHFLHSLVSKRKLKNVILRFCELSLPLKKPDYLCRPPFSYDFILNILTFKKWAGG